jgi:hypothetical protein
MTNLKDIEADLKKRIDGVPKRSIKDLCANQIETLTSPPRAYLGNLLV